MTLNHWPTLPLAEVLTKNEDYVSIDSTARYQQVTVRLWGRGVSPRGEVLGVTIGSTPRVRVRAGQFILSKIDARNGALGIVPPQLEGAVASNDFPTFDVYERMLRPGFLGWLLRTHEFVAACRRASEGTTNRVRLSEDRLLNIHIPLPNIDEQDRIVAKLDAVAARQNEAASHLTSIEGDAQAMLRSTFERIVSDAPRRPMSEVAPLVRRSVAITLSGEYAELGIRSFGRGTFHKPSLDYWSVGTKSLYRIEPGDLLFNNVFAWEGAIAVARREDAGRVGSHRFITCLPSDGVVTADFLCFYFLTPEGLERIGKASPGGAGRNRTLGLDKLAAIEVPVPPIEHQRWFDRLQDKVRELRFVLNESTTDLNTMMPAILDRTFNGAVS